VYRIGWRRKVSAAALWIGVAWPVPLASAVTVKLEEADARSVVLLHVGDRLRVDLRTAPASGFQWNMRKLDASHLQTLSKAVRPDSGKLDSAGTQVFVWKAVTPGHAQIELDYERVGDEKTVPATKSVAISVDVAPGELSSDDSDAGLTTFATYRGMLPCGDCLGISVDLTLYTAGAGGPEKAVFVQEWRYRGASTGDETHASTGRLTILHGTYTDADATIYVVDGERYRLEGTRLVQLDRQMLPITSTDGAAIALQKQPEAASQP